MEKEFLQLKKFLDSACVNYKATEHEPVFTSEQAASVRGTELKTGVKALVFAAEDEIVLALVPSDKKVDTKKLSAYLKKHVRLAKPEEVVKATGCEVGSVHPFGVLYGMRTIADDDILDNAMVNFNAGMHTKSISMKSKDLFSLIQPEIADIA